MRRQGGKWQATNDSIYDSIVYPLAKAVQNARTEIGVREGKDAPDWYLPTFTYIFPVLVTAGNIFTVEVVPDDAPIVTKADWVPLVRYFSDSAFLMDVVSFDSIGIYLQTRVFSLLNEASEALRSHIQFFDPKWLNQQYGESSDPEFLSWLQDRNRA